MAEYYWKCPACGYVAKSREDADSHISQNRSDHSHQGVKENDEFDTIFKEVGIK